MTYGAYSPHDYRAAARRRRRTSSSHAALCALVLIVGSGAGLAMLYGRAPEAPIQVVMVPSAPGRVALREAAPPTSIPLSSTPPTSTISTATPVAVSSAPKTTASRAATPLDPSFMAPALTAGYRPPPLEDETPSSITPPRPGAARETAGLAPPSPAAAVEQAAETLASIEPTPLLPSPTPLLPLPVSRPASLAAVEAALPQPPDRPRLARLTPAAPAPDTVFDKIFGRAERPNAALAYAAPEDEGFRLPAVVRPAAPDRWTAVYNIAAHTVTLPDGRRLEAHSGLGPRLDDPRSVTEHMRGATPPAVYDLTPREALFHGVAALRLTPIEGTTYGRVGLLAHTFMLGPRGDSNGCVVFRDYRAFRAAYDSGLVRRLVVVAGRA